MVDTRSSDVLVDDLFRTTVRLRTYVDGQLSGHGLSVPRLRLLRALANTPADEPLRMRDLGEALNVAARTVTSLVDALEREGMVERVRHPTDRRAYLLALTPLGRSTHAKAEEIDRAALARATRGLSGKQRTLLLDLLAVLRESVPDAPPSPTEG
ncbi:MarR family winged helix-turn-helix transcriptional regulator [Actinacidiphila bryophytorum]|uniref:Transcriptional regulator, MarR family n=1 Tax=Actinacidiphila bryophytorum TaxID=1436133 RepID=A0A9W4H1C1_9ACTN|nr:MarR family transcriptional regulator [Actinacidiphila bryophytorum]MBM9434988.1 MarR family transcriptional regulator [Actinacidiphila bryophytorum]MBN6544535.1 MarR family transcriptional regulator [Actinacidiphila bryophytorum]CAG7642150.1 Transcriptional regulator, MarR family [Actinacidiphila bryophytorum]